MVRCYLSGQANRWLHFTTLSEGVINMAAGNSTSVSRHMPLSQEYPRGQQCNWLPPGMTQQEWSVGHCPSPPGQTITSFEAISFCKKTNLNLIIKD